MKSIWEQTRKEGIISKAIEPYVKLAAESTIIRLPLLFRAYFIKCKGCNYALFPMYSVQLS